MSARAGTPPKRRAENASPTPPPKASRMSASAPVFNPSKPLPSSSHTKQADDLDAGVSEEVAEGESSSAGVAAAIAKSRVTRPLPNSRRVGAGADFVPKAATVPRSAAEKENTRRLIVVLSQVRIICLPIDTGKIRWDEVSGWVVD